MRILDWLSGLLGPKHTFESVALELARGLADGSITLDGRPERPDPQAGSVATPTPNAPNSAAAPVPQDTDYIPG